MNVPSLTIELRGQKVFITDVSIMSAERDIGIMSSYVDDYTLKDVNGKELNDWIGTLNTEEEKTIIKAIYNNLREDDEPEEDQDYEIQRFGDYATDN